MDSLEKFGEKGVSDMKVGSIQHAINLVQLFLFTHKSGLVYFAGG